MAERTAPRKGRPRRRPDRALSAAKYDAKRKDLIDIAAHVFARQGFHVVPAPRPAQADEIAEHFVQIFLSGIRAQVA